MGVNYKAIVLPAPQRMPDATKKKLEEYKRMGGFVFDTRETPNVGAAIKKAITPDLERAPEIGFVHRHLPYAEVYFLANTSNHPVKSETVFRTGELKPAWWTPMDGRVISAGGTGRLTLDLAPYESRVLVFSKQSEGILIVRDSGLVTTSVTAPWKVTFVGTNLSESMDQFKPWTADDRTKYFSGTATYESTVNLPAAWGAMYLSFGQGTPVNTVERRSGNGMRAMLEGPVREAAPRVCERSVRGLGMVGALRSIYWRLSQPRRE